MKSNDTRSSIFSIAFSLLFVFYFTLSTFSGVVIREKEKCAYKQNPLSCNSQDAANSMCKGIGVSASTVCFKCNTAGSLPSETCIADETRNCYVPDSNKSGCGSGTKTKGKCSGSGTNSSCINMNSTSETCSAKTGDFIECTGTGD